MAKLKPWYSVVFPREDLRDNRPMDASEFAVHLDHIREHRDSVSQDYLDPSRFFARTYLTKNLLELSSGVVRRLSGVQVETSAVFNMATQFGGGKTHSLTTLYHLATQGDKAKNWSGVDRILKKAEVAEVPQASVAVFVGTEFDAITGRGGDGEPTRRTPWGEIAWQLGGAEAFAAVEQHDKEGVAPAGDALRAMLPQGPTLILMDEIINYVSRGRKQKAGDQLYNFLQNLSEEARARNNMVLCVSIPASVLEMNAADIHDHESFKKLLDRVGKPIMMSAETEISEIIRRRLFEWQGLPEDAKKVASAYAEWAIDHSQELSGVDPDSVYDTYRACYPFHPSVLSVFERKWQTLPRFQRTRGVLRLLALWVAQAYQEGYHHVSREPLITFGSAPFDNPHFRNALFEQLGATDLEGPVTTDIVGRKDAHAVRLDREAAEAIRKANLHRKVASAIFFESNGGMTGASRADATLAEIRTAVGNPDLNMVDVEQVLEGLESTCYYLNASQRRYRFGIKPNLNQIVTVRRGNVQRKEIVDHVKGEIQKLFVKGPAAKDLDRRYFPARSNDVPNHPVLTLAVMDLDHTVDNAATGELMESIVRECGNSSRTYKSAILFAVPESSSAIYDAARDVLAWEAIKDDTETTSQLDETQEIQLSKSLKRAESDLRESIWRAYRYVYLLGKDNTLRQIDLGQITSSSASSLVELYLNELRRTDEITDGVGANKLVKYWPPALTEWSTRGARDAFFSSPQLPRLLNGNAIRRTIADGVSQGLIGYATKDSNNAVELVRFDDSMSELDVELSDEYFILKADEARKLLEPPRLADLRIQPPHQTIAPGETVAFTCTGIDQYGDPIELPEIAWSAPEGDISNKGVFRASEEDGGLFTVRAAAGGVEAIAEVRVKTAGVSEPVDASGGPGASAGTIRWSGDVPPQKWMNFYMRVVNRFVSSDGLKLRVSFEVPADGAKAEDTAEEIRAGLKELGLDDDVQVG